MLCYSRKRRIGHEHSNTFPVHTAVNVTKVCFLFFTSSFFNSAFRTKLSSRLRLQLSYFDSIPMNVMFTEQNNKATPFSLLYLTCSFIFNIHVALSISLFKDKTMNYMQGQLHSYYEKMHRLELRRHQPGHQLY